MSARDSRRSISWDDGVASERTVLSWERTALSTVAVAVILMRAGIVIHELAIAIPITVLLVFVAVAEWLFSQRLYDHQHDRPLERGAVLHERAFVVIGVVTLTAAAAAIALALGT